MLLYEMVNLSSWSYFCFSGCAYVDIGTDSAPFCSQPNGVMGVYTRLTHANILIQTIVSFHIV